VLEESQGVIFCMAVLITSLSFTFLIHIFYTVREVKLSCYNLHGQDNNEPKRKAIKRSTKSEKEPLELTLMYQKAIAERDSGMFSIKLFLILIWRGNSN
jgi:hypothetical protein